MNLRTLVQILKKLVVPSETRELVHVSKAYQDTLKTTKLGSINRQVWWMKWHNAYREAKERELPVIQGSLAVRNFLEAVQYKIAPD